MKRAIRVISALLTTIMVLSIAGCGKNTFKGGEGTNFPYTWKEERKGTILLTLDGSNGPEGYHWKAVSSDEKVLTVTVAKKEKKGKISFRIKPNAEGPAQITFALEREVQADTQETVESSEPEETQVQQTAEEGEAKQDNAADEGEIDLPPLDDESVEYEYAPYAAKAFEAYQDQYRAKDVICEIEIHLNSLATKKQGKYKAHLVVAETKEHKGIMKSTDNGAQTGSDEFAYTLWEDTIGMVQLRLPSLESEWSVDWLSNYVAPEDPGIPGIVIPSPEKENGKDVILEVTSAGYFDGAQVYTIRGLFQGTATIEFSNPEKEKHLLIDISITKNGVVSVLSHKLTVPQG